MKNKAEFYEKNDLSTMMVKNRAKKKVFNKNTKRVTMNISFESYEDANKLNRLMGMGYQNVLKTAMLLGLRDLRTLLEKKKKISSKN